jgi:hypothetical protein
MLVLIRVIPPLFPGRWHHPQTYQRPIKFVLRDFEFECHSVQLRRRKYARSKAIGVSQCDVSPHLSESYPQASTSITHPTVIPSFLHPFHVLPPFRTPHLHGCVSQLKLLKKRIRTHPPPGARRPQSRRRDVAGSDEGSRMPSLQESGLYSK